MENGYTFHDYNIKLNDVIQLMVRAEPIEEPTHKSKEKKQNDKKNKKDDGIIYEGTYSYLKILFLSQGDSGIKSCLCHSEIVKLNPLLY